MHHVVGGFKTLTIDGSLAGDADVLLFHGEDHGHPTYIRIFHIVKWVGRTEQNRASFEVQGYIAFEVDRSSEVFPRTENESTSTAFIHGIDSTLNHVGIQCNTVCFGSEIRNLVIFGRELRGAAHQGDG